jgi:hypothetical protein
VLVLGSVVGTPVVVELTEQELAALGPCTNL